MADALAITQEETRINATIEANLHIRANQFNKPSIENLHNLEFNGSVEDCFDFIEQVTLIAKARNWPIEDQGSYQDHFGGTAANAAVAPWSTPDPQIAAETAGRPLTHDEKTLRQQGLYHKQAWKWTQYDQVDAVAAGNNGAGLGAPAILANQSFANIELDGVEVVPGQIIARGDHANAQSARPIIRERFALVER